MEKITSRDNKHIKEFGKLAASKAYRDQTGRFVIESVKLVREALLSGVQMEKVFVTQPSYEKNYEVLQKLFAEPSNAAVYGITTEIEQKLSQTNGSQGIFAVCKKLDKHLDIDKIKNNGKYVYLNQLQDTGNVGTIIRTADALGLDGLIVSKNTCDITSLKVLRSSMGSVFRMKVYQGGDAVSDLIKLNRYFTTFAAVVDENAPSVTRMQFPENCVVLIGNEGNGLEREVVDACTERLTIHMKGNTESLNAGMAAGILMWEMMK